MLKTKLRILLTIFILSGAMLRAQSGRDWREQPSKSYNIFFSVSDKDFMDVYGALLQHGCDSVQLFFGKPFPQPFDVFIYPGRNGLDSTWAKDWKIPGFKSECWMVASGVAKKIDILSPARWDAQSCEHSYSDKKAVAQLITHELFHVYHGQFNASPDFSETENIDWFVEGLATYASGQFTKSRILELKQAILHKDIPSGLDQFWTGKMRYGLSGSVVAYIDHLYGRVALQKLLVFNQKSAILASLGITETQLLDGWKEYVNSL